MIINKPIDQIKIEDFENLVKNKITESKLIEFKKEIAFNDEGKYKLLKEVTAFANLSGGQLIYGIAQNNDGTAIEVSGTEISNQDEDEQRIQSLIRDNIDPRINGIELKFFPKEDNKFVILIQVPKSWNSPHQIRFGKHRIFYIRNTNGVNDMDAGDLRFAFNARLSLDERISNYIKSRHESILGNDSSSVILNPNIPKYVMHIIPFSFNSINLTNELKSIQNNPCFVIMDGHHRGNILHCLEGVTVYGQSAGLRDPSFQAYTTFNRNGSIEAVYEFNLKEENNEIKTSDLLDYMLKASNNYFKLLKTHSHETAYIYKFSLLNVKDSSLDINRRKNTYRFKNMILPNITIDDINLPTHEILKPVLDIMFNGFGYERCIYYKDDGTWDIKSHNLPY